MMMKLRKDYKTKTAINAKKPQKKHGGASNRNTKPKNGKIIDRPYRSEIETNIYRLLTITNFGKQINTCDLIVTSQ